MTRPALSVSAGASTMAVEHEDAAILCVRPVSERNDYEGFESSKVRGC